MAPKATSRSRRIRHASLDDYRNGTRDNAVMSAMAKPLTEKEIRDLAGYFSRQHGLITKR